MLLSSSRCIGRRGFAALRLMSPSSHVQNVHTPCLTTALNNSSTSTDRSYEAKRRVHVAAALYAAHQPFTLKTVEKRIMLVLALFDKIDTKKLTMDANFFTDLGLDSLDFVEVIVALEDEFMFEIPDGDSDRMKTPRDIFQYICDKQDVYD